VQIVPLHVCSFASAGGSRQVSMFLASGELGTNLRVSNGGCKQKKRQKQEQGKATAE
jgi:hypothetical protein